MGLKRIFSKKIAQLCCVLVLSFPAIVYAIGLGEIKLRSALNETLDAEIALLQMGSITFGQLQVGLASPEEFKQFDAEQTTIANSLTFKLTYNNQKKPIILVSSDKPIDTPILTFIVRLDARNGKLLRQYTLFLDPPQYRHMQVVRTTMPEKMQKPFIAQPLTDNEQEPVVMTQNTLSQKEKPVFKEKVKEKVQKAQEYGPTTKQDTLWGIASQYQLEGTSPQQFMLATFQKNPDAFTYNNMNGLKTNVVLVMPSVAEVNAISRQVAMQEMREQKKAWDSVLANETVPTQTAPVKLPISNNVSVNQTNTSPAKPKATTELKPSVTVTPSEPSDLSSTLFPTSVTSTQTPAPTITMQPEQGTQTIPLEKPTVITTTPPSNQSPSQPNENILLQKGGNDDLVKTLQNELTVSTSALNESKQTNEFLKQKMDDMTLQYKQILNLLSQKDLRINELEKNLTALGQAKAVQKGTGNTQVVVPGKSLSTETVLRLGSQGGSVPEPKKGISVMLGLSIFVVLLLLGAGLFWMYRRRQFSSEEKFFFMDTDENHHDVPDVLMEGHLMPEQNVDMQTDAKTATPKEVEIQEEAAVYMAYGRYQRAAQVIEAALAEKSDNVEMLVMLLECYANLNDRAAYDSCFSKLPADLATQNPELERKIDAIQQQMFSHIESSTQEDSPQATTTEPPNPVADMQSLTEMETTTEPEPESTPNVEDTELSHELAYEPVEIKKVTQEEKTSDENNEVDDVHTIAFDADTDMLPDHAEEDTNVESHSAATKLDLAHVYIDMDEVDEARTLLVDVQQSGDDAQRQEATELLKKLETP